MAILLHTLLSLTGVSLIIKSSATLFLIVQLIGASYLAWIGANAIKGAIEQWNTHFTTTKIERDVIGLTPMQGFRQGLYTNLLNPKAMIFFIVLFSTMITPEVSLLTKISATFILLLLSLFWFCIIVLVLSKPRIQQKMRKATPVINLLTGCLFLTIALIIISGII